jgi:phage shock protein A
MALLERVAALVRANLNDLIDKAEEPEKMIKQVILDMQNQLLQIKTQVAIAMADEHLLARRAKENEDRQAEWMDKAKQAVAKKDDGLARAALERAMSCKELAKNFHQQVADQKAEVENLKSALRKLEGKLQEAQTKCDLLIARSRRARAAKTASEAKLGIRKGADAPTFDRLKNKVAQEEAVGRAWSEVAGADIEDRFAALEKEKEIDRLLADLKSKKTVEA